MENKETIRIQFDEFQSRHFDIAPIWEFATDEEGDEDQDETTLRPRLDIKHADPSEGILIVECEFETGSGKKLRGLCTPHFDNSLSYIQPYILTDNGMGMFWFGMAKPDADTKKKIYESLGENVSTLFPIKFNSILSKPDGQKIQGQIDGFMWLDNGKTTTEK